MSNEEAILNIDMALSEVEWQYPMDYAVAFKMATEALEKQIPKKPDRIARPYLCPICATPIVVEAELPNHCYQCGQRLEWR